VNESDKEKKCVCVYVCARVWVSVSLWERKRNWI